MYKWTVLKMRLLNKILLDKIRHENWLRWRSLLVQALPFSQLKSLVGIKVIIFPSTARNTRATKLIGFVTDWTLECLVGLKTNTNLASLFYIMKAYQLSIRWGEVRIPWQDLRVLEWSTVDDLPFILTFSCCLFSSLPSKKKFTPVKHWVSFIFRACSGLERWDSVYESTQSSYLEITARK